MKYGALIQIIIFTESHSDNRQHFSKAKGLTARAVLNMQYEYLLLVASKFFYFAKSLDRNITLKIKINFYVAAKIV